MCQLPAMASAATGTFEPSPISIKGLHTDMNEMPSANAEVASF